MISRFKRPELICVHPDLKNGCFLFADQEARVPLVQPRSESGVVLGEFDFIGYGLPSSLAEDFFQWLLDGQQRIKSSSDNYWKTYDQVGRELAKNLAVLFQGQISVLYLPLGRSFPETMQASDCTENKYANYRRTPENICDDASITFCFSRPNWGWIQLAIMTDSPHLQDHVMHCSDVFDPMPDLVEFMVLLATQRDESFTLKIDEEGHFTYLTAHPCGEDHVELVVEEDFSDNRQGKGVETKIIAFLPRRVLLIEFLRRWESFLTSDYDPKHWNLMDLEDHTEDEIQRFSPFQPPKLDVVPIRRFISDSNLPSETVSDCVRSEDAPIYITDRYGQVALRQIVSGGQTGVDRGALDAALSANFPVGGWCPEGRQAEDGVIPERYPLKELPGGGYRQRTKQNVIDSDATLIVYFGVLSGGTEQTLLFCIKAHKPYLLIDAEDVSVQRAMEKILGFLKQKTIGVLNVAGPRGSSNPNAQLYTQTVIAGVLKFIVGCR